MYTSLRCALKSGLHLHSSVQQMPVCMHMCAVPPLVLQILVGVCVISAGVNFPAPEAKVEGMHRTRIT